MSVAVEQVDLWRSEDQRMKPGNPRSLLLRTTEFCLPGKATTPIISNTSPFKRLSQRGRELRA